MSNIFFGLNIGRSSLLTHQSALEVAGHNLANADTDGYSRQRASLVQGLPTETPQGPMGSGVTVVNIQRLQVGYLARQITQLTSQHGYDETTVAGLAQLEGVVGEPSTDGIGAALTEFWNSWESLAGNPSDASLRTQVLDRAEHLCTVYNQKTQGLLDLEAGFQVDIADAVTELNAWADKLASLNMSISKSEAAGYAANDLRDQRDELVSQIAQKVGVEVETEGANLNLKLTGSDAYLVSGRHVFELSAEDAATGEPTTFRLEGLPVSLSGGEIGALVRLRDRVSTDLRVELAELMATVSNRVDGLHAAGFDREGIEGLNLFAWEGGATSIAFPAAGGLREVGATNLEPGTHHLEVTSASLTANTHGTLTQGQIELSQTGGAFTGKTLNLDYHVRVVSPNAAAGSLDGLTLQLYRGDEAVGPAQTVSGTTSLSWDVEGVTLTADLDAQGGTFVRGERSDGLTTIGKVSLDGGPEKDVNLLTDNNISFSGGTGFGYSGLGSATVNFSGDPFSRASFTLYSPTAQVAVNPVVAADSDKVVAAAAPASGDGDMARQIADLGAEPIFEEREESPADFLGRTVQSLGTLGRDATIFEQASASILQQMKGQRESAVGVNVDEEMVQLMQFQRGFEAAARFVTTMDTLIETLINRVGAGA